MSPMIRLLRPADVPAVVALSLRAWAPVFASFAEVLGPRIYGAVYPDWRPAQSEAVTQICAGVPDTTWVAVSGDAVTGFIAAIPHPRTTTAEIEMLAVDPAHQNQGTATAPASPRCR